MVKLADLRRDRGMTQQQLAEALGVTRNTVGRWEMDDGHVPSPPVRRYLGVVFGVEPGEIEFGASAASKRGRPFGRKDGAP